MGEGCFALMMMTIMSCELGSFSVDLGDHFSITNDDHTPIAPDLFFKLQCQPNYSPPYPPIRFIPEKETAIMP